MQPSSEELHPGEGDPVQDRVQGGVWQEIQKGIRSVLHLKVYGFGVSQALTTSDNHFCVRCAMLDIAGQKLTQGVIRSQSEPFSPQAKPDLLVVALSAQLKFCLLSQIHLCDKSMHQHISAS